MARGGKTSETTCPEESENGASCETSAISLSSGYACRIPEGQSISTYQRCCMTIRRRVRARSRWDQATPSACDSGMRLEILLFGRQTIDGGGRYRRKGNPL
jgi:hypothetical protein